VSKDNARRNGVENRWSVVLDGIDSITRTFDVVLANILSAVLIDLSDDLKRLLSPSGTLVISGVLDGRYDHVLRALEPLVVVDSIVIDGWATLALVH
jgi:ribosomal protein L11 methyltransferase